MQEETQSLGWFSPCREGYILCILQYAWPRSRGEHLTGSFLGQRFPDLFCTTLKRKR